MHPFSPTAYTRIDAERAQKDTGTALILRKAGSPALSRWVNALLNDSGQLRQ
jgi:hypothetical protein